LWALPSVLGSFIPENCYKIIFLNQLFSLGAMACEVHGTCKQCHTQGPSLTKPECCLVTETALHWVRAHTISWFDRDGTLCSSSLTHEPPCMSVFNPLLAIPTSIPYQLSKLQR
jgi:hypothetical protein